MSTADLTMARIAMCEIVHGALLEEGEALAYDEAQRLVDRLLLDLSETDYSIESAVAVNELERKVALLEAFVKAEDAFNDNAQSEDWDEDDALYHQMLDARAALDWLPR